MQSFASERRNNEETFRARGRYRTRPFHARQSFHTHCGIQGKQLIISI